MKNYFIRLFSYDAHANRQMNALIAAYGDMEKPRRWLAHLLNAQQIWLARCKDLPTSGFVLWPDGNSKQMAEMINSTNADWLSYLESLLPEDIDRLIYYKTLSGINFENSLSDILAHIINHGTHHRAQIVSTLNKPEPTCRLPTIFYTYAN